MIYEFLKRVFGKKAPSPPLTAQKNSGDTASYSPGYTGMESPSSDPLNPLFNTQRDTGLAGSEAEQYGDDSSYDSSDSSGGDSGGDMGGGGGWN